MNKQINFLKRGMLLVAVVGLFSTLSVFAASEKNQLLVTQNLSRKLQSDLGNDAVRVKLSNVKEHKISENEIGFKGDAVCIIADDEQQLAIQFEAKINSVNQSVSDVKYDFVENASSYNPTSNEEILMKELMSKIKNDYKTENIVIAIDSVENVEGAPSERKFLGVGEVRIGDLIWNKIRFDVVLDAQSQKANKIVYQVQK